MDQVTHLRSGAASDDTDADASPRRAVQPRLRAGAPIRAFAWETTPLGPEPSWPSNLRATFDLCLASAVPMVIGWGPQLTLLHNEAAGALFESCQRPLLGRPLQEAFAEIRSDLAEIFDGVLQTGTPAVLEDLAWPAHHCQDLDKASDGAGEPARSASAARQAFYTFSVSALDGDGGPPRGVLITAVETTRSIVLRDRALVALERQRAEVQELLMQAPAPFCVFRGPDLIYELANPAYVRLFGRPDIVGKKLLEALPEVRGQAFDELLLRVMQTGIPHVGKETRTFLPRTHNGPSEERYWTFIYSPLRSLDGNVDRVMAFAWEVTEQVYARQSLDKARRRAEEATLAKDQFLAMLGHELRNPLAPIMTALQLMQLRGLQSREVDVIQRQVGHLLRLVDDLLDVARITRGKLELRRERIELASVVVKGIEIATPMLEQRQQRLEVNVPPEGLLVDGDAERLAQVVSNLLTNAAKYSEPGGCISVSARRRDTFGDDWPGEDRQVELSIKDQGIGIQPEMLDCIFESFVQHRQALDRASGGLGLGLAIVRSLVRMHGGTVTASSDGPGKGSEFRVCLPIMPADESRIAVVDATEDSGRILLPRTGVATAGSRVLVVDDNTDGAEILAESLRELGYRVEIAHDGPSALELAARFKPEIALLDIGLPKMDGYELATRLQELGNGTPMRLVAVTGYGQDTDRIRSARAGFAAHLVKPVNLDLLDEVVRSS